MCGHPCRYAAVEEDCSTALAIDENYVKAYLRRGVARRHLGKCSAAIQGNACCFVSVDFVWDIHDKLADKNILHIHLHIYTVLSTKRGNWSLFQFSAIFSAIEHAIHT